jgi:putative photosynthetic complex assembly protein
MDDHHHNQKPFPRLPLIGAALLISFSLGAVALARLEGGGAPQETMAVVTARDFVFEDRPDGSVAVLDAGGLTVIDMVAPGTNGFLRTTLRGLARERKRSDLARATPFRLTRWADGKLTLEDLATSRKLSLQAFGAINAEAFGRLLNIQVSSR